MYKKKIAHKKFKQYGSLLANDILKLKSIINRSQVG